MKGHRARLMLLLLLCSIPLAAAGVWFWIQNVADRRWDAAQQRIQTLIALHPLSPPRPADATSSEAAKEIQALFVGAIRAAVQQRSQYISSERLLHLPLPGPEADGFLDDVADFQERIHEGARRCIASLPEFPRSWRGEWDTQTMTFIMNCGIVRSRRRCELGAAERAADPLLDLLPLLRFWGESQAPANRVSALGRLARVHDELRDLILRERLSPELLRRLEAGLDLDEQWQTPPWRHLESRLARSSEELLEMDSYRESILDGAPYRWRYLLPWRLMKAEAFEFIDGFARELQACEGKPYLELRSVEDRRLIRCQESRNPLITTHVFLGDPGWAALPRRAESRLLRSAARFLATGEVLALEDPFGTVLQHAGTDRRMKFWSLGRDGIDNQGIDPRHRNWDNFDETGDIVIEVERR